MSSISELNRVKIITDDEITIVEESIETNKEKSAEDSPRVTVIYKKVNNENTTNYYKTSFVNNLFLKNKKFIHPITKEPLSQEIIYFLKHTSKKTLIEYYKIDPKNKKLDVTEQLEQYTKIYNEKKPFFLDALSHDNCIIRLEGQVGLALIEINIESKLYWLNAAYNTILTSYPLEIDPDALSDIREKLCTLSDFVTCEKCKHVAEVCVHALQILNNTKIDKKQLQAITENLSDDLLVLLMSADVYLNQYNDTEKAYELLTQVLQFDANHIYANKTLEKITLLTTLKDLTKEELEEYVKKSNEDITVLRFCADLYINQHQDAKNAQVILQQILEIDSNNSYAIKTLKELEEITSNKHSSVSNMKNSSSELKSTSSQKNLTEDKTPPKRKSLANLFKKFKIN